MKKALSIFFLLLSLLALKNKAYAETPIDACINFNKAGDYKRAIEAGKLAVKKYPKNSDAYYCLGRAYFNIGELKLAYENMKKAESLTNKKEDLMHIYNKIGLILYKMGNLDDALLYQEKSLSLAKELNDTKGQATVLIDIANIYLSKRELDKAVNYYNQSLDLQTGEKEKANIYLIIAAILLIKGDYQKTFENLQKAIEMFEKSGDYRNASMVKLNLGAFYIRVKDYNNAEKYLSEGLEGVKNVGDKHWEAMGYKFFGMLYRDKGDKKTAKEYYVRAYDLFKSIKAEKDAQGVLNEMKELDKSN
jgi:tetratricopeptide (TPR) repeat protein